MIGVVPVDDQNWPLAVGPVSGELSLNLPLAEERIKRPEATIADIEMRMPQYLQRVAE
jgi:hypothetical protein